MTVEEREQFYLHQYLSAQPDLNYRNPLVLEEMKNVLKFWLDLGVDGFRMDAVVTIWEDDRWLDEPPSGDPNAVDEYDYKYYDHIYTANMPQTRDILKEFYSTVKEYGDDKLSVLEAWVPDGKDFLKYYECSDFPFNFNFPNSWGLTSNSTPPFVLDAKSVLNNVNKWMEEVPMGKTPNWVLGNHDNPRVPNRYGAEFIDALNMAALTLPGTAVTYQGEELGMTDNLNISFAQTQDPKGCNCGPEGYMSCSRDPERTPFQWNSLDATAGFSNDPTADTWLPVNSNYEEINMEEELYTYCSHLSIYQKTRYHRKYNMAFKMDNFASKVEKENVMAFSNCLSLGLSCYVTMVNFSNETVTDVNIYADFVLPSEMGNVLVSSAKDGNHFPNSPINLQNITMDPYEGLLFHVST